MDWRIKAATVVRYPVLRITYTDGFEGDYDLSALIADGPMFEPLKDREYFNQVAVGERGRTFGWNLDDTFNEIDFCPDATRIHLETQAVHALAEEYDRRLSAAE